MGQSDRYRRRRERWGFSLVELLVVIGIIAVLIGLFLPAMVGARKNAQTVQCASNLRQLCGGLINYSAENRGMFPPNVGALYTFWTSKACIGKYIKPQFPTTDDTVAGGVMRCPADLEDAVRCYSMNVFASAKVSVYVEASLNDSPPSGRLWKANVGQSSNMILLIESFATEKWPTSDEPTPPKDWKPLGIASPAVVGWVPLKPAGRFGYGSAGGGFSPEDQFGAKAAQVCYYRHRSGKSPAGLGDAFGKLNIGFADGHVDLYRHDQLVNWSTGKSTYEAMWSPIDREID
jgi:prepilin-type processing-associated H-X9-DG protein